MKNSIQDRSSEALGLTEQIDKVLLLAYFNKQNKYAVLIQLTKENAQKVETISRLEVNFEEEKERLKSAIEKLEAAEKKAMETVGFSLLSGGYHQ